VELVGVYEAARILGWDRRKVSVYYRRGKLPPPEAVLASVPGIDADLPLKIILSGQETLAVQLKRASLADLVNRINVRYHIKSLTKDQTVAYIDHRLKCAGATDRLMTSDAKALIHDYAGGVPRSINNIATACLIHAASQNITAINESIVNDTMAEFKLP